MKKNNTHHTEDCCNGTLYSYVVKCLFEANPSMLSNESFHDWKKSFTRIHGELDTQHKVNSKELETIFHISIASGDALFSLIFCLETYYSIVLRMMAFKAVFKADCYTDVVFHPQTFQTKGIANYDCVNYYNWFLNLKDCSTWLSEIYSGISVQEQDSGQDVISDIFERIFPKEIRHSLGEYYTPYWLADFVVSRLTEDDPERAARKYIDPACGSGTFLVALIHRFKKESGNGIFENICGIDINPLTVLAAKTNYLLLYSSVFVFAEDLTIPIYCADTIAINEKSHSLFEKENEYDDVPKVEYDYIVGNPPWVNWEYLPKTYRMNHASLWQYYNLFPQKGLNANFIKEDVSVLMTYVVIDNYLKKGGKLGFVIKETLFKSIKQGEGFRYFRINPTNTDLKVSCVDDLTLIKPFRGAATRTALLFIKKGEKTSYPIDYIVWQPKVGKSVIKEIANGTPLKECVEHKKLLARPSVPSRINSGWITELPEDMKYSRQILGENNYTARTGVFTGGANGIFWLSITQETPRDTVMVSNITDRAKNKMRSVSAELEKDYVFPFLTGNELDFWHYAYTKYILCPHTSQSKMYPVGKDVLRQLPKMEAYLLSFKKELEDRKGFTSMDEQIHQDYYYTLQRIGEYTFSRYKVCWRYISKSFTPAVVEYADDKYLGTKTIIGNEKIIFIGLDDCDEAYYLCGIISSTPYRKTIENYMVGTQITPSIINKLRIPSFNRDNAFQQKISELCKQGHQEDHKQPYIDAIDKVVNNWLFSSSDV